ncbi:MAG: hypothetical protein WC718_04305 [Phycisphaerales bacterium]|jgi:hypothetical protein
MAARVIEHIELWSDYEGSSTSAARMAIINDWLSATDTTSLDGKDTAHFELHRLGTSWPSILERRVLRVVFKGGTSKDWRIVRTTQTRGPDGLRATVECEGIRYDLAQGMVTRTEANGDVNPYFELYNLSPAAHAAVAMAAAPTYFTLGSVGSTGGIALDPLDIVYDWDNPLSALTEIATQAGLELDVQPASTTPTYVVSLSTRIGSTFDPVYIRYSFNMLGLGRDSDARANMATRVYPRGGGEQGDRMSIADASWLVSGVSSKTVTLSTVDGPPIRIPDQLNGRWVEEPNGVITQVADSSTGYTVVLASAAHGIAVGERIHFRSSSGGADLVYLEHPANVATYGRVVQVYDRQDIPPVDNLLANPYVGGALSTASVPTGWAKVGAPTITASTVSIYTRYGTQSLHVVSTSSGVGVESSPVTIEPSSQSPFFTGQIALLVKSGVVRLELVDVSSTQGGLYPPEGAEPAITSVREVWVENLAVAGIDLYQVGSTGAKIRVTSHSTEGAEWYLDAGQFTQTAAGAELFYDTRGTNYLWREANEYLVTYSWPYVSFEVSMADLERMHPGTFLTPTGIPINQLKIGGMVVVTDPDMGFDIETRVLEIRRDLDNPGQTSVVLSNRPEDLSGLGVPGRRGRKRTRNWGSQFRRPTIEVAKSTAASTSSTGVTFVMTARTDGALVAMHGTQYLSTLASTGATRYPPTGWKESGYSVNVTVPRPTGKSLRALEAWSVDYRGSLSDRFLTYVDASPLTDILSLGLKVNEKDGSARIAVRADAEATHVRVAWTVDRPSTVAVLDWPTTADLASASIANGRLRALAAGSTLAWSSTANTVKIGQAMRLLAAAYPSSSTDWKNHGRLGMDADMRGERVPTLLESGSTEAGALAGHAVTVIDPSTWQAATLYYRTKLGVGSPGAWTFVDNRSTGALANGVRYSRTVATEEKHQSFVEWKMLWDSNDSTGHVASMTSPGFDRGNIPDVAVMGNFSTGGQLSVVWQGDFDTHSVKIAVASSANPTIAAIRAAGAHNGRVGATVHSTASDGQTWYIGCLGYSSTGGGGNESSTAFFAHATFAVQRNALKSIWVETLAIVGPIFSYLTNRLYYQSASAAVKSIHFTWTDGSTSGLGDFDTPTPEGYEGFAAFTVATGAVATPYNATGGAGGGGDAGTPMSWGGLNQPWVRTDSTGGGQVGTTLVIGNGLLNDTSTDLQPRVKLAITLSTAAPAVLPDGHLWGRY